MANEPREYRKGNWTIEETMVLIEAKKMDDERRLMIRHGGENSSAHERGKPGELRWKRVEDYCWKNGCFRSQNQCNDKWDNLMRDFKKVREYQRRVAAERGGEEKFYWKMEKNQRKEHGLPSNMLPQIFDALFEVVERKVVVGGGGGGGGIGTSNVNPIQAAAAQTILLPLPPPAQPPTHPFAEPSLPTADSDTSGHSDSQAKRRRRRERGGGREGDAAAGDSSLQEVCSAISQSGSIIAEAIHSCEEREERRHRQVLSLHERRLEIEESNAQINRQGINGLVDAINKLENSILALASHKNQPDSK